MISQIQRDFNQYQAAHRADWTWVFKNVIFSTLFVNGLQQAGFFNASVPCTLPALTPAGIPVATTVMRISSPKVSS